MADMADHVAFVRTKKSNIPLREGYPGLWNSINADNVAPTIRYTGSNSLRNRATSSTVRATSLSARVWVVASIRKLATSSGQAVVAQCWSFENSCGAVFQRIYQNIEINSTNSDSPARFMVQMNTNCCTAVSGGQTITECQSRLANPPIFSVLQQLIHSSR